MSVAKRFYWEERTTLEFDELAAQDSIAILPVAATEQHGPHLSVATDSAIGRGMLECLRERIPGDISVSVRMEPLSSLNLSTSFGSYLSKETSSESSLSCLASYWPKLIPLFMIFA